MSFRIQRRRGKLKNKSRSQSTNEPDGFKLIAKVIENDPPDIEDEFKSHKTTKNDTIYRVCKQLKVQIKSKIKEESASVEEQIKTPKKMMVKKGRNKYF